LMQPFINLGTQFIGYRNTVNGLKGTLPNDLSFLASRKLPLPLSYF
jgi:hypothetical protein